MEEGSNNFILDCSMTMAWCFDGEATPYTDGIRDRLGEAKAFVPALWPFEVANVILIGERRNRLDRARSLRFINLLSRLPIVIDELLTGRVFADVVALARDHRLSGYDAAYLELALRRSLPLATLHQKLAAAARAVGVVCPA